MCAREVDERAPRVRALHTLLLNSTRNAPDPQAREPLHSAQCSTQRSESRKRGPHHGRMCDRRADKPTSSAEKTLRATDGDTHNRVNTTSGMFTRDSRHCARI